MFKSSLVGALALLTCFLTTVFKAHAHPANYVANTCNVPNKTSVIMNATVLSDEDQVAPSCKRTSDSEKSLICSLSFKKPSEVMFFVDENDATLSSADFSCGTTAHDSHDDGHGHDHRQLAACTGVVACSEKVLYTSQKAQSIDGLKITTNSNFQSGRLVLLSAEDFGTVKRAQFDFRTLKLGAGDMQRLSLHVFPALLLLATYLVSG